MRNKILLVEDSKIVQQMYRSKLTIEQFTVQTADNGMEAIKLLSQEIPDVILLDLMMPGIDGFKLCRLLREDPKFTHTPIIIVTALSDNDSRIVAFGAGANDYLTKPYHPRELVSKIRDFIDTIE